MNLINFTGSLMVLLFILVGVYAVMDENGKISEATKVCEFQGGVYIDNVRRVGKSTSHEYMCMRKSLFIMTTKDK